MSAAAPVMAAGCLAYRFEARVKILRAWVDGLGRQCYTFGEIAHGVTNECDATADELKHSVSCPCGRQAAPAPTCSAPVYVVARQEDRDVYAVVVLEPMMIPAGRGPETFDLRYRCEWHGGGTRRETIGRARTKAAALRVARPGVPVHFLVEEVRA